MVCSLAHARLLADRSTRSAATTRGRWRGGKTGLANVLKVVYRVVERGPRRFFLEALT